MSEKLIDPNAAVDFMIAKSAEYAQAEANKVYMEELRKTIKAEEMKNAEILAMVSTRPQPCKRGKPMPRLATKNIW